jgi:N-acetylmuramoyl-L-alanine amidase
MTSIFRRNDEPGIRREIFQGIYEENLRILGKAGPTRPRRKPFPSRKVVLFVAVCLSAILVHSQYMGPSFSPAEMTGSQETSLLQDPASEASVDLLPPLPMTVASTEQGPSTSEFKAFENGRNVPLSRMLGLKIRTIMIDPGHGGTDPGTIGKMGTKEKDITLDIARRLRTLLVQSGRTRVLLTRDDDSTVPLTRRVALAQEAKTDLFISVHLNYIPQQPINIIETYYFGPSDDKKTLKLAEQENRGSEYGLSDFREIMEKLGKTMKLQESREFAKSIQANLFLNSRKHSEDIQNHGVKRAPFVVLLGVDVPAVLAEVSCLSNREEEQELNSESHRENIATYLASGIFDYLNKGALIHEARR